MTSVDLGAEEWDFPDPSDLTVPDAARLWYDLDQAATEANKRAARLKQRRAAVKELALQVLDASGQTSARVEVDEDRELQITPYDWEVFSVKDEAAFKDWAAGEAENYYDDEPRLREGVFLDSMRRRSQDGEPLPPGVVRWVDTRISRTAVPKRRTKRRGGPGTEQ